MRITLGHFPGWVNGKAIKIARVKVVTLPLCYISRSSLNMCQVVPALDPSTPIYASSFVMRLVQRRLTEYSLFDESRFKQFDMNKPFKAGPFE
jgi:hypothetical protein